MQKSNVKNNSSILVFACAHVNSFLLLHTLHSSSSFVNRLYSYSLQLNYNTRRGHVHYLNATVRMNCCQGRLVLIVTCPQILGYGKCLKCVKTSLLLSNVIYADHQNTCLFTNKGHFPSPLWVLIGVLAQFHE